MLILDSTREQDNYFLWSIQMYMKFKTLEKPTSNIFA